MTRKFSSKKTQKFDISFVNTPLTAAGTLSFGTIPKGTMTIWLEYFRF